MWWLNQSDATAQHLAYVNEAGNAIIKVDNTTYLQPGQNRNTVRVRIDPNSPSFLTAAMQVRLTSTDFYDWGSVWIFDALHLPYGCSVWPAFWAKGPTWPDNGEIGESLSLRDLRHN